MVSIVSSGLAPWPCPWLKQVQTYPDHRPYDSLIDQWEDPRFRVLKAYVETVKVRSYRLSSCIGSGFLACVQAGQRFRKGRDLAGKGRYCIRLVITSSVVIIVPIVFIV